MKKNVGSSLVAGRAWVKRSSSRRMFSAGGVTIYRGEALNVLRELPENSVDCVLADPPYSSGGLFRGDRAGDAATKYIGWTRPGGRVSDSQRFGSFGGDSRDGRAFAHWCALWLGECWRIARPGAQCFVFTDWRQLPAVSDAMQAGGWVWRGLLVWDKGVGRPLRGRFRNHLEYVVWGSSGAMPGGLDVYPGALLRFPPVSSRSRLHATEKPVALLRVLLSVCPAGGVVLDPFLGVASTMVAAVETGRRGVGVELDGEYIRRGLARLRAVS